MTSRFNGWESPSSQLATTHSGQFQHRELFSVILVLLGNTYVQWCYEARRNANTFRVIIRKIPRSRPVKSRASGGRERSHIAKWRQGAAGHGHAGGRPSCSLSRLSFATNHETARVDSICVIAKVAAPEPERRDQIFFGNSGGGGQQFLMPSSARRPSGRPGRMVGLGVLRQLAFGAHFILINVHNNGRQDGRGLPQVEYSRSAVAPPPAKT